MKKIQLVRLTLNNFKGIRHFVLDAAGENVKVYGDNATGKTTLFDAFTWLLFDKDSANRKDFEIKTLDSTGQPLHGIEHEVEGVLMVDSRQITLRKVFAEKWTKKRGSATAEFTGHTTEYFVDGVPVKQKEYKERVEEIVNEDVFKLLTSPTYFNEQLKWQKRREILLEVCGDVSDDDVIASNEALAKLPEILNGRSIDDHRKVIAARRAEINKELDKIPVRIDEVRRGMPNLSGLDEKALDDQIAGLKIQVESKEEQLTRIKTGGEITFKENRLREIEGELLKIKSRFQRDVIGAIEEKRRELHAVQWDIDAHQSVIKNKKATIEKNMSVIKRTEETAQKLRDEWYKVNSQTFVYDNTETTCPACGQPLPAEKIEEARAKAEAHFNLEKSKRLEEIKTRGKAEMDFVKSLLDENEELKKQIADSEAFLENLEEKRKTIESEIEAMQDGVQNIEDDPEFKQKTAEMEAIKQEIQRLRLSTEEEEAKILADIRQIKSEIERLSLEKAKFEHARAAEKRIAELSDQERALAAEYERLEHELFLTEEFIRTKVDLIEEKINSRFKYARFKLFERQINGGLAEVCETTFNGVPYSGGLNNAARINVGLDIINTLSDHYGISAPIFIDNAESVTNLIDTNAQMISLIVSENDKELRVDKGANELREAI